MIIAFILYKTGVWEAVAQRLRTTKAESNNSYNQENIKNMGSRLLELEGFAKLQKTNHNHDLESLLDWRPRIEARFDKIEERQDKVSDDLNFIKGKLNGQLK